MKPPLLLLPAAFCLIGLGGCQQPKEPTPASLNRFEQINGDVLGSTGWYVYRDKQTGRQYLFTTYHGSENFQVVLMPEEPKKQQP